MKKNLNNYSDVEHLNLKTASFLIALFIGVVIFWDTIFLYPIKIFVVILHEFSHGLAAILTGGQIEKIEINPQIGGVCYTSGGNRIIVLTAGYLGSMLWGSLILLISARIKYNQILGIIMGSSLIILALFFIRNFFGFIFAMGFGTALIMFCLKSKYYFADLLMKFMGMTSCLYAIIDIKSDLIDRTINGSGQYLGMKSDAFALAEYMGHPQLSVLIGVVWILISVVVFDQVLILASKGEKDEK